MQKMSRIVDDVYEEAIISLITNAGERGRSCLSEAESDTPTQKTLQPGTIGSVRIAPPGLRHIHQFNDNRGLEDGAEMTYEEHCPRYEDKQPKRRSVTAC